MGNCAVDGVAVPVRPKSVMAVAGGTVSWMLQERVMVRVLELRGISVVWPMEVMKVGSTTSSAVAPLATPITMPVHCDVMSAADPPVTATVGLPHAVASGRAFESRRLRPKQRAKKVWERTKGVGSGWRRSWSR